MIDPPDDIDEVALNVLLAEGVDLPTAWEASRRESNEASSRAGIWIVVVVLGVVGLILLVIS
jgi:hypothetical protein